MINANQDDLIGRIAALFKELFGCMVCTTTSFASGVASLNFLVRTSVETEFVARCDFRRPSSAFSIDVAFQSSAQRAGVNVPSAITYVADWPECSISLRRATPGKTLGESGVVDDCILRSAGEQLARIHLSEPPDVYRPWFYSSSIEDSEVWCELCNDARHAPYERIEPTVGRALELWLKYIETVQKLFNAFHVVHGDFKAENILVTEPAYITVLDWEKAAVSDPVFDLAFALFHLLCDNRQHEFNIASTRQFLSGYLTVRPLGKLYMAKLVAFVVVAASTFYLVDVAQQVRNERMPMEARNHRRTKYFWSYCQPVFETFIARFDDVIACFSDCSRSGALLGEG